MFFETLELGIGNKNDILWLLCAFHFLNNRNFCSEVTKQIIIL
jgi:hypothetical protein